MGIIKAILITLSSVFFLNIANATENINVILHHSQGGGRVPLVDTTDVSKMKFVCEAIGGTMAKVINKENNGAFQWFKVEAINGNCQGKSGWVSSEHVRLA